MPLQTEFLSIHPDVFNGFDAVPVHAIGPLRGRGTAPTKSPRGIVGYPQWDVAVTGPINDPRRRHVLDPINSNFPMDFDTYISKMWPRGGVYAPEFPGGRSEMQHPPGAARPGARAAIVFTPNAEAAKRISDAIGSRYRALVSDSAAEVSSLKEFASFAAVYIDMEHPDSPQILETLHAIKATESVPVFSLIRRDHREGDLSISRSNGVFLPICEQNSARTITIYLDQAHDKWALFQARHSYTQPIYSVPTREPGETEGWLNRLFKSE